MKTLLKLKAFFDDGNEHIDRNRYPYLGFHGVFRCAVETLDSQVLLDPFEEQFNMPAIPIQFGNGHGRKREVVCNKGQGPVSFFVPVLYESQGFGEIFDALYARKSNCLVTDKSCRAVHLAGVGAAVFGIGFGSQNKEAQGLMKIMQALKVKVGSIHNIEGAGLWNKQVKDIDIMEFAIGNVNESRDIATQIKEGMEFYGRFCSSKMSPRK